MWIKRSEAELVEERRRERRSRLRWALLFGAFVLLLVTFFFGGPEAFRRGRFTVPVAEILSRFPFAIAAGAISSFVSYKCERKRPMMICPKCEATKYDDGATQCSCGGHFETMDSMKYVA